MEFIVGIGEGVIGKIGEYAIEPAGRQVGYLIHYNKNIKELESQLSDLDAARQTVERKVKEAKGNTKGIEVTVTKWLSDVEHVTEEANCIFKEKNKAKMKCLNGFYPNQVLRYRLSRKSTKLVPGIVDLYVKKEFANFSYDTTPQEIPTKDYEAFGSRTSVVNQIMDALRSSPNTDVIGVYGFAGVGKTKLVKEVARQAAEDKTLFDDVVMVQEVNKDPSIERIQKEIGEKLVLKLPEDESPVGKARRLFNRIKDQKILVILDDIRERIDLEALGLASEATCKVLLTSRTRDVLSGMDRLKEFQLDVLKEEETQSLFQKMAGDVTKDPAIRPVANQVAKRCGGLPVLVVTIASALKNKRTLHAWNDALRRLKSLDKEKTTEKPYLALKWSYSQLNNEELKSLFLLCGLSVWNSNSVATLDLLKYCIGLGLLENIKTMGEAWDSLNSRLDELKDSCLLLNHDDNSCVEMHGLVRDVAIRIAERDQHVLKVAAGDEFKEWPETKDFREKCTMVCIETSNLPKLPGVLKCQEVELFRVVISYDSDDSPEIPGSFFEKMTKLKVLDLTHMSIIPSLPSSLQVLEDLRTLCLDGCTLEDIALVGHLKNLEILSLVSSSFKKLPNEIGELSRLLLLDLTGCLQLEVISPNVLSRLKRLEELRMGNSFTQWGAEGERDGVISTERNNASLSELTQLSHLSALQIHILDVNILPKDLFSKALKRYKIYIGDAWIWDDDDDANFNTLKLKLTAGNELVQAGVKILMKKTDELCLHGAEVGNNTFHQLDGDSFEQLKHLFVHNAEFAYIINGKDVFPNLTKLEVSGLDGSTFLLSSSMARRLEQLTHLKISGCLILEEIVLTKDSDEDNMENMFAKLQQLELDNLPNLTSFCSRSCIQLPSLDTLELENYKVIEEMDHLENVIQHSLFDKKVGFPSLKTLLINNLAKITAIWDNGLSPESFQNLETISICYCESLISVTSSPITKSLCHLKSLEMITNGVGEIHAIEGRPQTTPMIVFSKLESLRLQNLPQLEGFYFGMHVSSWPSLESIAVYECNKVEIFAQDFSSIQGTCESVNRTPTKRTLFLIGKDSFPNLELLAMSGMKIWDGPFPIKFFRKLSFLRVGDPHSRSAIVLEKFVEGNINGEIHAVETISHLKELRLCRMNKLMHLGEDNSQQPGQNFPTLEILVLKYCDSLKNLKSSAISFKNIKSLEVTDCPGLEYLFTYSTAKNLTHLEELEVGNCTNLVEVVGSHEYDSGNEIAHAFSQLKYMKLFCLPRLQGFYSGNCIVKFPSLKTSYMSKRLKLKIFHENETDVDDDAADNETETAKKGDVIDIGADGEYVDETAQITNENKGTYSDGMVKRDIIEAAPVAECCAYVFPTIAQGNNTPVNTVQDIHIHPTENSQTQEDLRVTNEALTLPLTGSLNESEDAPKDLLADHSAQNAEPEEASLKQPVETNPSQIPTSNVSEACKDLDYGGNQSSHDSNPQILVNEVGQAIVIVDTMEGKIDIAPILKVQVQPIEIDPCIAGEVEALADQGIVRVIETSSSNIQITPVYSSIGDLQNSDRTCPPFLDVSKCEKSTTDGSSHFQSQQTVLPMRTMEEPQEITVQIQEEKYQGEGEYAMSLEDRLSALTAIRNKTKVILSAEDEVAKTAILGVQAEPSQLQYDVQTQERLKAALQHLKDKKLCNPKKLSSAMTSLNLIPQLSFNAFALRRKISALQEEEQLLKLEEAKLNSKFAGVESAYSALIQNRASLEELQREIQSLQAKASAMAGEISLLEGHIKSILVDPIAFEENACRIDVNHTTMHEVETELVNIEASLDRHTNVVTRLLKSLL